MGFRNLMSTDCCQGRWLIAFLALLMSVAVGCSAEPHFKLNRVELLKIEYQQSARNEPQIAEQTQQVVDILAGLFGTPDEPYFPVVTDKDDPTHDMIDLAKLKRAAGPVSSNRSGEQVGLYREHCAHCHGISGDGAGPTAGYLNPYPRDFRLGKFKYKSTKLGQPPTDDDLSRIIRNGVPGTAMPSFRTIDDDDVAALIGYVKYLSIRGQVEQRLLAELPGLKPDESLVDLKWRSAHPDLTEESAEGESKKHLADYEDQFAVIVEDIFLDVLDKWKPKPPTPVPDPPAVLTGSSPEHDALVQHGRDLFIGKANCAVSRPDRAGRWPNRELRRLDEQLA